MLNRRLIRIKTFKVLFATEASGQDSLSVAETELMFSCRKTRDLYYFLFNICGSLQRLAEEKAEVGRRKFHPTAEELNPNLKFVHNRMVAFLKSDEKFNKFCKEKGLQWTEYDGFVKKVFNSVISSDYYAEYMNNGKDSFRDDCKFFRMVFENEFEDNDSLDAILEEMSVYWIDDVGYVLNCILTTIDSLATGDGFIYPDVFIKEEDELFAKDLLKVSMEHYAEYNTMIVENVSNWDEDRIVDTDKTLIVMGIAEAINFPTIPVKVTINEYVDISKYYSTQNSRIFVNGLLDKIIQSKVASGEIVKSGRGLFDGQYDDDGKK